ncbi:MAG: FkbM family methyltransferase [Actinomycetota bacterium]
MLLYGDNDVAMLEAMKNRGYKIRNVFDIGASTSAWSRTIRPVFPEARLDMFEPLAEHNAEYTQGLERCLRDDAMVHLHPVAVGAEDGEIEMTVFPDATGSTTLDVAAYDDGRRALRVAMRSVDSVIAAGEAPVPDLLKVDIQGGELAVLRGARNTLPQVKFLLLETWLTRGYGANTPLLVELMDFLRPFRFVPYEFGDVFRDANDYAAAIDVLFINAAFGLQPHHYFSGVKDTALVGAAGRARRWLRDVRGRVQPAAAPSAQADWAPAMATDGERPPDAGTDADAAALASCYESDRAVLRSILGRNYPIDVVFDVGASNSSWSSQMAAELPDARFELFEPLANQRPDYRKMLDWHTNTHEHSTLHPLAIGDRNAEIVLQMTKDAVGSTTLPVHHEVIESRPVRVPMRTIDSMVTSGEVPRPDLLKLDIQGGELAALEGAERTLPDVTLLVMESWLVRGYGIHTPLFDDLARLCRRHGFLPFEFGDAHRDPTGLVTAVDVWFLNVRKSLAGAWYYTGVVETDDERSDHGIGWRWRDRLMRRFQRTAVGC